MRIALIPDIQGNLPSFEAVLMDIERETVVLLINPGSIGLPRDYFLGEAYHPPWAEYALVNIAEGKLAVDLRRIRVDNERVKQAFLASGMPHADWMAQDWH